MEKKQFQSSKDDSFSDKSYNLSVAGHLMLQLKAFGFKIISVEANYCI